MIQITDISPAAAIKTGDKNRSVTGRMLSIACAPDGSALFMGSYSNLWVSRDGGQNWAQLMWPQPAAGQFAAAGSLGGWCALDIACGTDANNQLIVLVMMSFNRAEGSQGIWRSADGGNTWNQVHRFLNGQPSAQLEWAQGSNHLVYAAGGSALAISKDAGATFVEVLPFGANSTKLVNHVAVWQNAPTDTAPEAIYALGSSCMAVSFDGGSTWTVDQAVLPPDIGGPTSATANYNSAKVMAISPLSPRQVYITANGVTAPAKPAALYLFDYSGFPLASRASTHQAQALPGDLTDTSSQDSGNVFVVASNSSQGAVLFYGAQRSVCYVATLTAAGSSSWTALDSNVHVDLHGLLLSPDFTASISGGNYTGASGTVWLLTDGGVHRSTNGGKTFVPGQGAHTLSAVNVAGAAIAGAGPALSLNTGDNDGFYSLDGGQTWSNQQYGGGDDDCSFADPMRPFSMFVATPRWDPSGNLVSGGGYTVTIYEAAPASLPNASTSGTSSRHVVPGPPPIPDPLPTDATHKVPGWNASSSFYSRGARPIVLTLAGEQYPAQGDYIFVLNPFLKPVLVRTQSIFNVTSRNDWQTTDTEPIPGAKVYLQGPPLPAPAGAPGIQDPNLGVVQASGGHSSTIFYVGGDGTLQTWTEGLTAWKKLAPAPATSTSAGVAVAVRFFASPYLPSLIYVLDQDHVKRSDDSGATWQVDSALETQLTWNGQLAFSLNDNSSSIGDYFDLLLTDMKFDPNNPLVRFATGEGGVFYTVDGTNWTRLLHTGAFPGRPTNCFYDPLTDPANPALYVGFAGRGIAKIEGFAVSAQPVAVSPVALTFPEQQVGTTSLQQQVTVYAGSATITGISFAAETPGAGADFVSVPPPGEPFTVTDGQLVITVWFRPSAGGARNAKLEIAHNQAGSPLIVELSGTGDAAPLPLLSVSPANLLFDPKKLTNHTVTLTNTGTGPLTISNISVDNPDYRFTTTCVLVTSVLNPGQQCTVTLTYNFIGPGGSSNLIITHNAVGSPTTVSLEATSKIGGDP